MALRIVRRVALWYVVVAVVVRGRRRRRACIVSRTFLVGEVVDHPFFENNITCTGLNLYFISFQAAL